MQETTIAPTDHIGDAETVYMTHEVTEGVGSCLGKAFREVWAPKGWTQTTREAYEAHQAKLATEQEAFLASPDAIMVPEGEPQAQDVINGERGGETTPHREIEHGLDDDAPVDAALPPELDGLVEHGESGHEVATIENEGGL